MEEAGQPVMRVGLVAAQIEGAVADMPLEYAEVPPGPRALTMYI
jgi:hypothetical protein